MERQPLRHAFSALIGNQSPPLARADASTAAPQDPVPDIVAMPLPTNILEWRACPWHSLRCDAPASTLRAAPRARAPAHARLRRRADYVLLGKSGDYEGACHARCAAAPHAPAATHQRHPLSALTRAAPAAARRRGVPRQAALPGGVSVQAAVDTDADALWTVCRKPAPVLVDERLPSGVLEPHVVGVEHPGGAAELLLRGDAHHRQRRRQRRGTPPAGGGQPGAQRARAALRKGAPHCVWFALLVEPGFDAWLCSHAQLFAELIEERRAARRAAQPDAPLLPPPPPPAAFSSPWLLPPAPDVAEGGGSGAPALDGAAATAATASALSWLQRAAVLGGVVAVLAVPLLALALQTQAQLPQT